MDFMNLKLLLRVVLFLGLLAAIHGQENGVRVVVNEGGDAVLPCSPNTKENLVFKRFEWIKDGWREVFLYDAGDHYGNGRLGQDEQFKGRVFHFRDELENSNASIKIRNTKVTDSGNYSCMFPRLHPVERFNIELVVGVRVVVNEGGDAVLPCSPNTKENLVFERFEWITDDQKEVFLYDAGIHYGNGRPGQHEQFKGRVFHFPDELENSNASVMIRNMKVTDSGNYSCIFPHLHPDERFNIELVVVSSPKPSVMILNATKDWSRLQCDVRGASPKPELEWRNRAGDVVPAEESKVTEREGRYDIILQTTVTKTDSYRCIITQQEIHHQTYSSETSVYFHECDDSSSREIIGWVCGLFIGALTLIGVLALLVRKKKLSITFEGSRHQRKDSPTKVPLNPDV